MYCIVGKSEGKRPLGGLRYRWVDSVKMVLFDRREWYDRDQWRVLMSTIRNVQVP
jgi:hypothetical protein